MNESVQFRPVILAGGSGTRFWPRSRKARAKQVLALDGEQTMIQETIARLRPLAAPAECWIITNQLLGDTIAAQLPGVAADRILREPAARNTAPAAGLAAFLLEKSDPDAVIGIFPADHVIGKPAEFLAVLHRAIAIAAQPGHIVVLGIKPHRAETGYGYIQTGGVFRDGALRVQCFTEKPERSRAEQFVAAGNYFWNSGIFFWSARTLADALREHLPETAALLAELADSYGTAQFAEKFAAIYPRCQDISVDYAVLEPRSRKGETDSKLICIPADFGWNDLGSWAALYEHKAGDAASHSPAPNVVEADDQIAHDAHGNYVYSPGRTVALVGVEGLVVVDTGDALLITTRSHAQDVGKIVKELAATGRSSLV